MAVKTYEYAALINGGPYHGLVGGVGHEVSIGKHIVKFPDGTEKVMQYSSFRLYHPYNDCVDYKFKGSSTIKSSLELWTDCLNLGSLNPEEFDKSYAALFGSRELRRFVELRSGPVSGNPAQ